MPEVIVTIEGTSKLKNKLNRANLELNIMAEQALHELTEYTVATAQALAPKDLGDGARGIHSRVNGLHAEVVVEDTYMVVMELGRSAGAAAPPVRALEGWASRHGFEPSEVYVLARSIGRRGIRARRYMERAAQLASQAIHVKQREIKVKLETWWSGY